MPIRKSPAKAPKVLVADDEPQVRRLFVKKLRGAGYDVTEAKSGDEALRLLGKTAFRVLVLDLDMPGADGFEVLKAARAEHPGLSVLVISGYMGGALLEAARCLGATMALSKTSAPKLLVPTVGKLVEG
jgi:two-component system response regulator AtoC